MNAKSFNYEQLELLPAGSLSTHKPSKVAQGLKTILGQVLKFFAPTNEPKIHSYLNQNGEVRFDVYDPVTSQRSRHSSEEAMRAWLEQRYYP